jgi:hypothetical protein
VRPLSLQPSGVHGSCRTRDVNQNSASKFFNTGVTSRIDTIMSKTSTKKGLNRKHISTLTATDQTHSRHAAAAASVADAKKRVSLGNTVTGAARKLRKKTRKKLSHQQAAEARHTLDAEFRDMRRARVSTTLDYTHTSSSPHTLPPLLRCSVSIPNDVVCAYLGGLIYPSPPFFTAYARVCPAACRR